MISLTSPVETRAHRWPAGVKLAGLAVATILLFAQSSPWFHITALGALVTLYALPGATFMRAGLRALWRLWPFVALLLAWHWIAGEFGNGIVVALRMLVAVGLANLVTMTTRLEDMMALVRWLSKPLAALGLNTDAIALAMALVIRFIPVLSEKGAALGNAWRARSKRKPGWRIIMPFIVLALDDADHVAEALRARGGI